MQSFPGIPELTAWIKETLNIPYQLLMKIKIAVSVLILAALAGCELPGNNPGQSDTHAEEAQFKLELANAESGNPVDQFNTGVNYISGTGVPKNIGKAISWWRKAAEQGHVQAQYNLGYYYQLGEGVQRDFVKAVFWFRKAAEKGDVRAQHGLGLCYYNGEGVPKDEIEAYAYFNLAGVEVPDSRHNLSIIEKKLSPDARLQGQRRTKELQKEIESKSQLKRSVN